MVGLLLLTGAGGYLALLNLEPSEAVMRERCTAVVGTETYDLNPDQASNAALIAGVALRRGLPPRAASIAIATAIQESGLRNLDYGDDAGPDSRGLFQQRPSQGWGTQAQVMDPIYAANAFYDGLLKVPGYTNMPITEAAQAVQISAFPEAYADHEPEARAFASALTGYSAASLDCMLRSAESPGDPSQVAAAAAAVFGNQSVVVNESTVTLQAVDRAGWATAQWAVANAKQLNLTSVSFGGLQWDRVGGWTSAETEPGTVTLNVAGAVVE
ncbi:hypothetical protein GCM10009611_14470 [Arthrobacter roseus]